MGPLARHAVNAPIDALFAGGLVLAGALVGDARPVLAVIEIAVGIAAASAFMVIEPATARAAFSNHTKM
jgi:hypothetical protein